MEDAVAHALRNLLNFQGRDRPRRFWLYILFICISWCAISWIASATWVIPKFFNLLDTPAFNVASDTRSVPFQLNAMIDILVPVMWFNRVLSLIAAFFTLAAFTRRLHDSDLTAYWAFLPYGILVFGLFLIPYQIELFREMANAMPTLLEQTQNPTSVGRSPTIILPGQDTITLVSSISWIQIIAFIILAARSSTRGPNRFGEEPSISL